MEVLIDPLEVEELQKFMVEEVDLIMALMEVSLMGLGVMEEEFKELEAILAQVGVVVNLLEELGVGPYLEEVGVKFQEVVVMSFEEQGVIQSLEAEEVIQLEVSEAQLQILEGVAEDFGEVEVRSIEQEAE